jgi:alpha-beta hydrolase superfamily lysophospholipase
MKTSCKILLILLFAFPLFANAQTAQDSIAKKFLSFNQQGKYDDAVKLFDKQVADQVSPQMMQQIWQQLTGKYGNYVDLKSTTLHTMDTLTIVIATCEFEKAMVDFSFAFNPDNHISGFHIIKVVPKTADFYSGSSSFAQENDTLKTPTGDIYGTLMLPDKPEKALVALIIAGSGPTDRNGNSTLGETSDVYKKLAEALAKNGIATLRYDKRGIGESRDAMIKEKDLRFDNYINDAAAWIKSLQVNPHFSKVIVIGHSEGSLIGMIAAREAHANAFISLAGAGRPINDVLLTQLKNISSNDYAAAKIILAKLSQGQTVDSIPSKDITMQELFNPAIQPYMISWMKYDPAKEIARLKIPVLIVNGTHDIQVPVSEAAILHKADPKAELLIVDGMNHILKDAPADRADNLKTYNDPTLPLDKTLIPGIITFLAKNKLM